MTYTGVFVDDIDDVYEKTLSTRNILEFQLEEISEVAVLTRKIIGKSPIIVAIDYRLDEDPQGLPGDQTFRGSALGQHLRDTSIERPENDFALVLVSAENKIRSLYRPDKTAHDLFDRVYVKEDINKRRAEVRKELISLCKGYKTLRNFNRRYNIVDLMSGADSDHPFVDIQEIRTKLAEAAAPHVAARILFGLIDNPGPLLDIKYTCAFLGIDPEGSKAIFKILRQAGIAYDGVFSEAWPRWWTNRLETWAREIFKRRATGLPSSERARLLSEHTGENFKPATSPWNGSARELISFACASCGRGTELRHSVAAFETSQPRYFVRRRICWDCIQTDRYESHEPPLSIDDADKELAEMVRVRTRESRVEDGGPA